jgi:hypothetical protein
MTETATQQIMAPGGFGAWEITIFSNASQGSPKVQKKVVIAKNLLDVATCYPDMMEASYLGQGECLIPAGGKGRISEE